MKIEKLNHFKERANKEIFSLYMKVTGYNDPPLPREKINKLKLLIADYAIAIKALENLIRNLEQVQDNCKQALKGEDNEYFNHWTAENTYDPYIAIYDNLRYVELKDELKHLYFLLRQVDNKRASTPCEFFAKTDKEQALRQDRFIIYDIEASLFFQTFDFEIHQARNIAESYGNIEEILQLIS